MNFTPVLPGSCNSCALVSAFQQKRRVNSQKDRKPGPAVRSAVSKIIVQPSQVCALSWEASMKRIRILLLILSLTMTVLAAAQIAPPAKSRLTSRNLGSQSSLPLRTLERSRRALRKSDRVSGLIECLCLRASPKARSNLMR